MSKLIADFRQALPISDGFLSLRVMQNKDAIPYANGTHDPLVKRFAHLPLDEYTPDIVQNLIHSAIEDGLVNGTLAVLTISNQSTGDFIGSLVFFNIVDNEAEIGYWVAPEHRGNKVSIKALMLAKQLAKKIGLTRLYARTVFDNVPSQKTLINAGFVQIGTVYQDKTPSGTETLNLSFSAVL